MLRAPPLRRTGLSAEAACSGRGAAARLRLRPREEGLEGRTRRAAPVVLRERIERPEERGEARQEVVGDARGPRQQQPLHLRRHALQVVAVAHRAEEVADGAVLVRPVGDEDGEQLSVEADAPPLLPKDGLAALLQRADKGGRLVGELGLIRDAADEEAKLSAALGRRVPIRVEACVNAEILASLANPPC